ncbi:hypothetical protein DPMN_002500 [Dreissena polymorpha]|uniref:Uncharacterized protein n=2 Tax=Dreissena polymorpha TaxID=45954 RepID=A0A9D4MLF7_DREPO|nr:hypothetical protein DPMN_002500 [Dreissena polymorpha]
MLRAPEVPGAPLQGLRGQHDLSGDASYSESKASARPTHRGILQHIRLCAEFHRRTEILDVRALNIPTLSILRIMSDFSVTSLLHLIV